MIAVAAKFVFYITVMGKLMLYNSVGVIMMASQQLSLH